jgi:type IV pilus assembly protein PilC
MVRSGEESGNLSSTFGYLADYLDRTYELISKTRNALVYPTFVIVVFVAVMVLMLVIVIPKFSAIILETGQDLPFYTMFVIGLSNSMREWGLLILGVLAGIGVFGWRFFHTTKGKKFWARSSLSIPYVGSLFHKLYLARIADNLNTMLTSGIAMVHAVEITAAIVGNDVYKEALLDSAQDVRSGVPLSSAMARHSEIPGIMTQMIKVGEETGEVGSILETLAKFYKREVDNAVDTLIGMIEPAMIIMLGIGVGGLLTSVLMPMYDVASSF